MAEQAVSRNLMLLEVVLFFICIFLSALVFMPISLVTAGFKGQCLLYSDIRLTWNSNDTVSVNLKTTRYGTVEDCDLPTFVTVTVTVACIVFAWFYICNILFAARETKESTQRIQVPALFVFFSLFISSIVAAAKLSGGFNAWCSNLIKNIPSGGESLKCHEFEHLEWTNDINAYMFFTRYMMAEVAAWLLMCSLLLLTCLNAAGVYQMVVPSSPAKCDLSSSQATMTESFVESESVNEKLISTDEAIPTANQDLLTENSITKQDETKVLTTEASVHIGGREDDKLIVLDNSSAPDVPDLVDSVSYQHAYDDDELSKEEGIDFTDDDQVPLCPSSKRKHNKNNSAIDEVLPTPVTQDISKVSTEEEERRTLAEGNPRVGGYGALDTQK